MYVYTKLTHGGMQIHLEGLLVQVNIAYIEGLGIHEFSLVLTNQGTAPLTRWCTLRDALLHVLNQLDVAPVDATGQETDRHHLKADSLQPNRACLLTLSLQKSSCGPPLLDQVLQLERLE